MSDVCLSLVLSLTLSSGWTLDLFCSLLSSPVSGPFSCCSRLDHKDGSQIFLVVCCIWDCWQVCLSRADAAGPLPGQWGHCLRWGHAQLLSCPFLAGQAHSCCALAQWSKKQAFQMQSFHSCLGLVLPHFSSFRSGRLWQNRGQVK